MTKKFSLGLLAKWRAFMARVSAWLMWTLLKWVSERTSQRSGQIDKSNRCLSILIVACNRTRVPSHESRSSHRLEQRGLAVRELCFQYNHPDVRCNDLRSKKAFTLRARNPLTWLGKRKEIAVAISISVIHSSAFSYVREKRVRTAHNDMYVKHACRRFVLSRSNDSVRLIRVGYESHLANSHPLLF